MKVWWLKSTEKKTTLNNETSLLYHDAFSTLDFPSCINVNSSVAITMHSEKGNNSQTFVLQVKLKLYTTKCVKKKTTKENPQTRTIPPSPKLT